jgi:hypothetical protein
LLLFERREVPGLPFDDVTEVSNYIAALEHGLSRLTDGFPLSNRLLREVHGRLLAGSWRAFSPGLTARSTRPTGSGNSSSKIQLRFTRSGAPPPIPCGYSMDSAPSPWPRSAISRPARGCRSKRSHAHSRPWNDWEWCTRSLGGAAIASMLTPSTSTYCRRERNRFTESHTMARRYRETHDWNTASRKKPRTPMVAITLVRFDNSSSDPAEARTR